MGALSAFSWPRCLCVCVCGELQNMFMFYLNWMYAVLGVFWQVLADFEQGLGELCGL